MCIWQNLFTNRLTCAKLYCTDVERGCSDASVGRALCERRKSGSQIEKQVGCLPISEFGGPRRETDYRNIPENPGDI